MSLHGMLHYRATQVKWPGPDLPHRFLRLVHDEVGDPLGTVRGYFAASAGVPEIFTETEFEVQLEAERTRRERDARAFGVYTAIRITGISDEGLIRAMMTYLGLLET